MSTDNPRPKEFDRMVEDHYRQRREFFLHKMARALGGRYHVAEEVVQEAYTRCLENWEAFNNAHHFATWFENFALRRAKSDAMITELRHGQNMSVESSDKWADTGNDMIDKQTWETFSPEEMLQAKEMVDRIMDKGDSDAFILNAALVYGENYERISSLTGRTVQAIKLVVHKFKRQMQNENSIPRHGR